MTTFDALTLALEDWFATPLSELPEALRRRVKKEFAPMPWDQLSAEQRRSVTLQLDYQHDPATEKEREYWWDFFERMGSLKKQIAQWEAVTTPTAGDLALRESRLAALKLQLAKMEDRENGDRRNSLESQYRPAPKPSDPDDINSSSSGSSPSKYVAYPKAFHQLVGRIDATPAELAAWVWFGPTDGGIAAYVNANELDPPPRFRFWPGDGTGTDHDYVSPLMACWFRVDEVARFEPAERYLTGSALIKRWSNRPGLIPEAYIRAKIKESRLLDAHPIYGCTQASEPDVSWKPPLADGLHRLSDVEAIEAEDFPIEWDAGSPSAGLPSQANAQSIASETVIVDNEVRRLPEASFTAAAATDPPVTSGAETKETGTVNRPCGVFLSMPKLRADELTIAFVGDRSDAGLGANNMLEISARKTTRRVAMAALDLVDRRKGGPNSLAAILLGMATGRRLKHSIPNATKVKRLRGVMRNTFGLDGDPFQPYRQHDGWVPCFKVIDKRGAADERAKREGERRTASIDDVTEYQASLQQAQDSRRNFEAEGDDADAWLRQNDEGDAA